VETQQEKLAKTQERFGVLGDGIEKSSIETANIKSRTAVCDTARNKVEEINCKFCQQFQKKMQLLRKRPPPL